MPSRTTRAALLVAAIAAWASPALPDEVVSQPAASNATDNAAAF
jgi:hypothetical protein